MHEYDTNLVIMDTFDGTSDFSSVGFDTELDSVFGPAGQPAPVPGVRNTNNETPFSVSVGAGTVVDFDSSNNSNSHKIERAKDISFSDFPEPYPYQSPGISFYDYTNNANANCKGCENFKKVSIRSLV